VNGRPLDTTGFGAYTPGGSVDRVYNDLVNVYGWMPTSSANPTLIASTGVEQFSWVAYTVTTFQGYLPNLNPAKR
jgi:hypothetical protein